MSTILDHARTILRLKAAETQLPDRLERTRQYRDELQRARARFDLAERGLLHMLALEDQASAEEEFLWERWCDADMCIHVIRITEERVGLPWVVQARMRRA